MKILVFSTKPYDREFFAAVGSEFEHEMAFLEARLTPETSLLAEGFDAVCVFVNDQLHAAVLRTLAKLGIQVVALRCAGFNNVDMAAAHELGIKVVRVPAYSPHAVAEHTVGLILTLNRKIHRAYARVRDGNFYLGGLLGFDLCGRTVGVIGTGQIGLVFARIMSGFGCQLLGYDKFPNKQGSEAGLEYVDLPRLFSESDIISLHCPLTPETYHQINADSIAQMRDGVMIVNTSRGAVIDTQAVIAGLKSGKIGHLGLDVYEEEADLFFEDLSNEVIPDDMLSRLLTFPNVVITGHQAFFTALPRQRCGTLLTSSARATPPMPWWHSRVKQAKPGSFNVGELVERLSKCRISPAANLRGALRRQDSIGCDVAPASGSLLPSLQRVFPRWTKGRSV